MLMCENLTAVMAEKPGRQFGVKIPRVDTALADAEHLRELTERLGTQRAAPKASSTPVSRPVGLRAPVLTRYKSMVRVSDWARPEASLPLVDLILQGAQDRLDRAVLSWPKRCCDGAVAAALALREARARGQMTHMTLAMWPWRSASGTSHGSMAPTRSVFIEPRSIVATGQTYADLLNSGPRPAWLKDGLAHDEAAMLELRLRSLSDFDPDRLPTLRELTLAFDPQNGSYAANSAQILRRVLHLTEAGARAAAKRLDLSKFVGKLGCPLSTPFAIFGLPPGRPAEMRPLLSYSRFMAHGLDAILLNLHESALSPLADQWEGGMRNLLEALPTGNDRPPLIAFSDSPRILKAAEAMIVEANRSLRRVHPRRSGIFCPEHAPIGPAAPVPRGSFPTVDADIKDAELTSLRRLCLAVSQQFRDAGARAAARAARDALRALHQAASMPLGLNEMEEAARLVWEGDTAEETAIIGRFIPRQSLAAMEHAARRAGVAVAEAALFAQHALERIGLWAEATPVSLVLDRLLEQPEWNGPEAVISFPDRDVADLYGAAVAPGRVKGRLAVHETLGEDLAMAASVLVVAPRAEAIEAMLSASVINAKVLLLGDCAGIGLAMSLLGTVAATQGMEDVAKRARDLRAALERGGARSALNIDLDLAEQRLSRAPLPGKTNLDFTGGQDYTGRVFEVRTTSGALLRYRPGARTAIYTPYEARIFHLVEAKNLEVGALIVVFHEDLQQRLRTAMARSSATGDTIRHYHEAIAAFRKPDVPRQATEIARAMDEMGRGEELNIRRWLRAGENSSALSGSVRPDAPRDLPRFKAFALAIGIAEYMIPLYWQAITLTRSISIKEGAFFHDAMTAFLVDPEGNAHRVGKDGQRPTLLNAAALQSAESLLDAVREAVDTVIDVRETTKAAA